MTETPSDEVTDAAVEADGKSGEDEKTVIESAMEIDETLVEDAGRLEQTFVDVKKGMKANVMVRKL